MGYLKQVASQYISWEPSPLLQSYDMDQPTPLPIGSSIIQSSGTRLITLSTKAYFGNVGNDDCNSKEIKKKKKLVDYNFFGEELRQMKCEPEIYVPPMYLEEDCDKNRISN